MAKVTRGGRGGEPIQKSLHDAMRVQNRRLYVNFDCIYTRDVQTRDVCNQVGFSNIYCIFYLTDILLLLLNANLVPTIIIHIHIIQNGLRRMRVRIEREYIGKEITRYPLLLFENVSCKSDLKFWPHCSTQWPLNSIQFLCSLQLRYSL